MLGITGANVSLKIGHFPSSRWATAPRPARILRGARPGALPDHTRAPARLTGARDDWQTHNHRLQSEAHRQADDQPCPDCRGFRVITIRSSRQPDQHWDVPGRIVEKGHARFCSCSYRKRLPESACATTTPGSASTIALTESVENSVDPAVWDRLKPRYTVGFIEMPKK